MDVASKAKCYSLTGNIALTQKDTKTRKGENFMSGKFHKKFQIKNQ
jgi:ribosomal protein L27